MLRFSTLTPFLHHSFVKQNKSYFVIVLLFLNLFLLAFLRLNKQKITNIRK